MQQSGSTNGRPGPQPFGLHYDAWGRLVLTDADVLPAGGIGQHQPAPGVVVQPEGLRPRPAVRGTVRLHVLPLAGAAGLCGHSP